MGSKRQNVRPQGSPVADTPKVGQTILNTSRLLSRALVLVVLAAVSSPISQLALSPVYGAIPASIYHQRLVGTTTILAIATQARLHKYFDAHIQQWTPCVAIMALALPLIQTMLFKHSDVFGPSLGPLLTEICTFVPLLYLSVIAALTDVRTVALHYGEWARIATFGMVSCVNIVTIWAVQSLSSTFLSRNIGSSLLFTRSGLQYIIAACYALLMPSKQLGLAMMVLVYSLSQNNHLPLRHTTVSLNQTLNNMGFSLVARQESLTGYISVLENIEDGFRAMRCDHSLLGGEWIDRQRASRSQLGEPIYSCFVMLEAVRLVETGPASSTISSPVTNKQALVIGLGIGTSPSAMIAHGIQTTIVEIDPVVYQYALEYFHLPNNHTPIIEDAVTFVDDLQRTGQDRGKYDFIIHDVFTGGAEPAELFTQEFLSGLSYLLDPEGVIAINYGGDLLLETASLVVNTILSVFPRCRLFREEAAPVDEVLEKDFTNMVMFCRKSEAAFTFRNPTQEDFLGSQARKYALLPEHEIEAKYFDPTVRDGPLAYHENSNTALCLGELPAKAFSALDHKRPSPSPCLLLRPHYLMISRFAALFADAGNPNDRGAMPLFRGRISTSSAKSAVSSSPNALSSRSRTSLLFPKNRKSSLGGTTVNEETDNLPLPSTPLEGEGQLADGEPEQTPDTSLETPRSTPLEKPGNPIVSIQAPTPDLLGDTTTSGTAEPSADPPSPRANPDSLKLESTLQRPEAAPRRQSLAHSSQTKFLETLLESEQPQSQAANTDYFGGPTAISASMLQRKIWVKRAGASATLVSINEDDLVDDVRDRILKKYTNSLGRSFDAPDVALRIVPRDQFHPHSQKERTLGPEEPIARTLDAYFPGGQSVDEALVIDVPRRTPRHSPRPVPYYLEDPRPAESGTDYFPVIPAGQHSPHIPSSVSVASGHAPSHHLPLHSISVLNTGQVPPLPSPGGTRSSRIVHRPKYGRTHTTSPTVLSGASGSQTHENQKSHINGIPAPPPIPSPALPNEAPHRTDTPPPRVASPRPLKIANKGPRKPKDNSQKLPAGLLDGAVPPINVLIVEDNIINLKLLEAFMKRLKVRWHTAMNGREAVTKWRAGGFHLVLMDIQLPVMNGLDATKEIRRLERLNNIGVFSGSASNAPTFPDGTGSITNAEGSAKEEVAKGEDSLMNTGLFKSPVIIVALTASSLQSDRHEALAAGCNDFLTKPVNFVWLERKVMEWGCMQALIDYDGWRKWKDINKKTDVKEQEKPKGKGKTSTVPSPTLKRDKRLDLGMDTTSSGSGSEGLDGSGDGAIAAGA